MDAPQAHEQYQFSLRALLLYTFGAAALVSLFACESPLAMFAAWLLLLVFFRLMRCKECIIIMVFGVVLTLPIWILGNDPIAEDNFLKFGCRVGGTVGFIAFHVLLFVR
jgi:hypothetical protein